MVYYKKNIQQKNKKKKQNKYIVSRKINPSELLNSQKTKKALILSNILKGGKKNKKQNENENSNIILDSKEIKDEANTIDNTIEITQEGGLFGWGQSDASALILTRTAKYSLKLEKIQPKMLNILTKLNNKEGKSGIALIHKMVNHILALEVKLNNYHKIGSKPDFTKTTLDSLKQIYNFYSKNFTDIFSLNKIFKKGFWRSARTDIPLMINELQDVIRIKLMNEISFNDVNNLTEGSKIRIAGKFRKYNENSFIGLINKFRYVESKYNKYVSKFYSQYLAFIDTIKMECTELESYSEQIKDVLNEYNEGYHSFSSSSSNNNSKERQMVEVADLTLCENYDSINKKLSSSLDKLTTDSLQTYEKIKAENTKYKKNPFYRHKINRRIKELQKQKVKNEVLLKLTKNVKDKFTTYFNTFKVILNKFNEIFKITDDLGLHSYTSNFPKKKNKQLKGDIEMLSRNQTFIKDFTNMISPLKEDADDLYKKIFKDFVHDDVIDNEIIPQITFKDNTKPIEILNIDMDLYKANSSGSLIDSLIKNIDDEFDKIGIIVGTGREKTIKTQFNLKKTEILDILNYLKDKLIPVIFNYLHNLFNIDLNSIVNATLRTNIDNIIENHMSIPYAESYFPNFADNTHQDFKLYNDFTGDTIRDATIFTYKTSYINIRNVINIDIKNDIIPAAIKTDLAKMKIIEYHLKNIENLLLITLKSIIIGNPIYFKFDYKNLIINREVINNTTIKPIPNILCFQNIDTETPLLPIHVVILNVDNLYGTIVNNHTKGPIKFIPICKSGCGKVPNADITPSTYSHYNVIYVSEDYFNISDIEKYLPNEDTPEIPSTFIKDQSSQFKLSNIDKDINDPNLKSKSLVDKQEYFNLNHKSFAAVSIMIEDTTVAPPTKKGITIVSTELIGSRQSDIRYYKEISNITKDIDFLECRSGQFESIKRKFTGLQKIQYIEIINEIIRYTHNLPKYLCGSFGLIPKKTYDTQLQTYKDKISDLFVHTYLEVSKTTISSGTKEEHLEEFKNYFVGTVEDTNKTIAYDGYNITNESTFESNFAKYFEDDIKFKNLTSFIIEIKDNNLKCDKPINIVSGGSKAGNQISGLTQREDKAKSNEDEKARQIVEEKKRRELLQKTEGKSKSKKRVDTGGENLVINKKESDAKPNSSINNNNNFNYNGIFSNELPFIRNAAVSEARGNAGGNAVPEELGDAGGNAVPEELGDAADPAADPLVDPAADPLVDPAARPFVAPVVDPAADPLVDPAARPFVAPVVDPAADPLVAPVARPFVAPLVDPAARPFVAPVVDPAADPAARPFVAPVIPPTKTITDFLNNDLVLNYITVTNVNTIAIPITQNLEKKLGMKGGAKVSPPPRESSELYDKDDIKKIFHIISTLLRTFSIGRKSYIQRDFGCLSIEKDYYDRYGYIGPKKKIENPSPYKIRSLDDNGNNNKKLFFYTLNFPSFIEVLLNQKIKNYNQENKFYYSENQYSRVGDITPDNIIPIFAKYNTLPEANQQAIMNVAIRMLLIPSKDLKLISGKDLNNSNQYDQLDYASLALEFNNSFHKAAILKLEERLKSLLYINKNKKVTKKEAKDVDKPKHMIDLILEKKSVSKGSAPYLVNINFDSSQNNLIFKLYEYLMIMLKIKYYKFIDKYVRIPVTGGGHYIDRRFIGNSMLTFNPIKKLSKKHPQHSHTINKPLSYLKTKKLKHSTNQEIKESKQSKKSKKQYKEHKDKQYKLSKKKN